MSLPLLPSYTITHRSMNCLQDLLSPLHRQIDRIFSSFLRVAPPPPFDPTAPSSPISFPIKTLEDLESRAYFDSFHFQFNKASVPLSSSSSLLPDRPRLLVCHDMAGGYGDDRWVQGGTASEPFDLSHWYLMDVFVYFSHSLVTLPPPSWTNIAHLHGVKVLGTFITEWDDGKIIANKLLSTKESAHMYAERLTELAVALGFDGWLLNFEVSLDISKIPTLKEFVGHLTRTMHSAIPGSLVIWYDSVTIEGKLSWQDQLNDKNKPFFDLCDGIFMNYTWKENYPTLSAEVAGERKHDVYMGIDVFGRNTFGGGQWNTNFALDLLKKDDVSAALFAPGWVYETKQPPDYQTAKTHWWGLVEKSWGVAQNYPKSLPFFSNFDQGHGHHFCVDGEQVLDTDWNNISCQGFQPFIEFSPQNPIQVFIDFKEASYSGGSNITFKGKLENDDEFKTRLFQGDVLLDDIPLYLTYSVKSESNSLLGIYLEFSSVDGEPNLVLLAPERANHLLTKFTTVANTNQIKNKSDSQQWIVNESSIAMSGNKLTEIGAVCYRPEGHNSNSAYYAVLGHISIKTSVKSLLFPLSDSWKVYSQNIKWSTISNGSSTVSVKITWVLESGDVSSFPSYNIYAEKRPNYVVSWQERKREFLGVARVKAFYVADFAVPSDILSVRFIIQVCGVDGSSQRLDDSPFLQLDNPKEE